MFILRRNYNFIILFLLILFINSCNQSDIVNSKLIIYDNISNPKVTNKKIIVNQINKKEKSLAVNSKIDENTKEIFISNETSKIIKKKLNLIDGIASNVINENNVVFEFRNETLLQGRDNSDLISNKKRKKALTAVFKMFKTNPSLENYNLNLKNNKNINFSIDYSLKSTGLDNSMLVKNILVFLPFTGPYSNFGNKIRQAIDLSILRFGSDKIKVIYFDTGTKYLLAEIESLIKEIKPKLVLGPFTRSSVLKIKPYVKKDLIPMFAFTNDIALVEKNIWSLGFSPEEQIDSVMSCALVRGYKNYGLIVPNDLYGKIILDRSIDNLSIKTNTTFKQLLLSNSEMKNKTKLGSILTKFLAYNKEQNVSSSKFDAIFIGGNKNFILEIAPLLAFYDVDSKKVQILGTEIFDDKAIKDEPSLEKAWFPMLFADKKARVKQQDFKLFWKNSWNDNDAGNYFTQIGFDAGILAINFLNQDETIEEYIKKIEGLVTGFKFKANGYVKKAVSIVEIQKLGKLRKIKECFNTSLVH